VVLTDGRQVSGYHEYIDNVELDRLSLAWHTIPSYHADDMTLEVIAELLTGSKNGLLTKPLTIDREIAQSVSAFQFSGKHDGFFVIQATAKPGQELDKIKLMILEIVDKLKVQSPSERELQRTKNVIASGYVYRLQNLGTIADFLNSYNFYLGTPAGFEIEYSRYQNVSDTKVHKTFADYFVSHFCELRVLRKENGK